MEPPIDVGGILGIHAPLIAEWTRAVIDGEIEVRDEPTPGNELIAPTGGSRCMARCARRYGHVLYDRCGLSLDA